MDTDKGGELKETQILVFYRRCLIRGVIYHLSR